MQIKLETIGGTRPWVASITGTDAKHGLARQFLRGVMDYSAANRPRTRGVHTIYTLGDGLYEICSKTSWSRTERYFAIVTGEAMETIEASKAIEIAAGMVVNA